MESNRRTLMFLVLIAIAFIKLAVGNLTDRAICLEYIKYFCGGMDVPNIRDCGKWSILRYTFLIPNLPEYIDDYFEAHIFENISAPRLKTTKQFCSDRANEKLKLNDYDKEILLLSEDEDTDDEDYYGSSEEEDFDDEVKKSIHYEKGSSSSGSEKKIDVNDENYEKGSSSSGSEMKFDVNDENYEKGSSSSGSEMKIDVNDEKERKKLEEQKQLERMKLTLKYHCLDRLSDYTKLAIDDVIKRALFYVNLDTYENPTYLDSQIYYVNETAKDYLIHISNTVKVKNGTIDPVKYCLNLGKPKSSALPNEMYPPIN